MGAIEPYSVEVLTEPDAAAGVALSTEARWNQTEEDWRLFLRRGIVYGLRDPDGRVVATAAILPYGRAAWISLVLVTAARQRRGFATSLMARCLHAADEAGWQTWLDATPEGAAVYGPLGFEPAGNLVRLRRPRARAGGAAPPEADVAVLIALDREALGMERRDILQSFVDRRGSVVFGDGDACCLVREGRRARHIGPIYGRSVGAVDALLGGVLEAEEAELVLDLHAGQTGTGDVLAQAGFAGERPFLRMVRGRSSATFSPALAVASAGPEFG